jgi:hypothetical protein
MMPAPEQLARDVDEFMTYYLATRPWARELEPIALRRECARVWMRRKRPVSAGDQS